MSRERGSTCPHALSRDDGSAPLFSSYRASTLEATPIGKSSELRGKWTTVDTWTSLQMDLMGQLTAGEPQKGVVASLFLVGLRLVRSQLKVNGKW